VDTVEVATLNKTYIKQGWRECV